jgi:actin-related protein
MDDNVFTEADASAPELEATAAIEPVENTTPEEQSAEQEAPKTFTQEDLDAIVGKRLAREQRKWEREQAQRAEEVQARQQPIHDITPEQFETYEDYAEVLAERKAEEMLVRRERDNQQRAMLESYHEREEAARDKYDDFEQVAYNPNLPITDAMAMAIQASDVGPDVIYHLGINTKDAQRISRLDPILQAREIGMIEARLSAEPTFKKTSNAPAPIAPVNARTAGAPTFDTTDPRSVKSMSTSDWIEAERLRQIKKYEAQRNR